VVEGLTHMDNHKQCCCLTRKGHPCPINADRVWRDEQFCHVHDPDGVYQRSQRNPKPVRRITPRLFPCAVVAENVKPRSKWSESAAMAVIDDPHTEPPFAPTT